MQVDGVVCASCEEDLGGGVFESEVRARSYGAGWFGEGDGAVRCEG